VGSFTHKLYKVGDRTEADGTRAFTPGGVDISPSIETLNFLLESNGLISLIMPAENCSRANLFNKLGCHAVPNAFLTSIDTSLLKFKVTWSVSRIQLKCL
jgi:hypothetical protein